MKKVTEIVHIQLNLITCTLITTKYTSEHVFVGCSCPVHIIGTERSMSRRARIERNSSEAANLREYCQRNKGKNA